MNNCKHKGTWLFNDATIEWCYVCGSFRELKEVPWDNKLVSKSGWINPTNDVNNNPYEEWAGKSLKKRKRYINGRKVKGKTNEQKITTHP